MSLRKTFRLLPSLCLISKLLFSHETTSSTEEECCGVTSHSDRIEIRHIEAKGIGYNQGYTTLEAFLTPITKDALTSWIPFIDLRGHVFNDGNLAANAGIGVRYLTTRAWGINTYYDYRHTSHGHFNQVTVGLESLGKIWDFRLNGYLPFGKKTGHHFHTRFHEFSGNHMIISRKQEMAMKGANAEIGAHIAKFDEITLYAALGPYYFERQGKNTWGGEGRLVFTNKHFRFQISGSGDPLFHGIVQGELSLVFPFGGKKEIKRRKCCNCSQGTYTCKQERIVRERAVQKVDRFEIIVLDRKRRHSTAINPVTGQPYFFWFVDNTSHSNGTFESPFNTLLAAQNASSPNDVIYVFPGDGTSNGMNTGITLKNSQKLLGAGTSQKLKTTFGNVTIPALASALPLISNSSVVIQCADNNEISGIHVTGAGVPGVQDILCSGINNTMIHDNFIDIQALNSIGIELRSPGGQISIMNNTFNFDLETNYGIDFNSPTAALTSYLITNNQFISPAGLLSPGSNQSEGIRFGPAGSPLGAFRTITIANNQFAGIGGIGTGHANIDGQGFQGSGELIIDGNFFSHAAGGSNGAVVLIGLNSMPAGSVLRCSITNNIWTQSVQPTIDNAIKVVTGSASAAACVTLTGNRSDITATAYRLDNLLGGGTINADHIDNNIGTVLLISDITISPCP